MDKNFNDDELSDIMKEIEALEEDFTEEAKENSPVLAELAEMSEETEKVVSLETKRVAARTSSTGTRMSFQVQGDITLELTFGIGGKEVALQVTEAGLTIEMDGGVKFTVPITEKSSLKKAV